MRKFNIKVKGKLYEAEVEKITAAVETPASVISSAPATPAPVVSVTQAASVPAHKTPEPNKETAPAPKPAALGKGETLSCPMP